MKTELIERGEIEKAASFIKNGGLVVFPTETVYGLGANAYDDAAVSLIFAVKRRPIVNPLIVHVDSIEKARELTSCISSNALRLMQRFTPSPITFVLKSAGRVSGFACGGLSSIAIRIPNNPVALDLIKMSGVPIAASSANLSRRPSATNFLMASKELNGLVRGIIKDDVSLNIGIESTIVSFTDKDDVLILRSGAVTREAIQQSLGKEVSVEYSLGEAAALPSNLLQHYRPRIPVYLFNRQDNIKKYLSDRYTKVLITRDTLNSYWFNKYYSTLHNVCIYNTLEEYAASIYREFVESEKRYKQILAEYTHNNGLGYSINNRLMKASLDKFINN